VALRNTIVAAALNAGELRAMRRKACIEVTGLDGDRGMAIGAVGANALFSLGLQTRTQSSAPEGFLPTPANTAARANILPIAPTAPLSFETVINLQTLDEPETSALTEVSATEKFLEEARKSPIERMREQILAELGLSEEALAQMPPEERRAAEEKIRQLIEEKFRQGLGAERGGDSNASMIAVVA